MKKEALLYEKLDNIKVKCNVCARRCIITEGKRGNCNTRLNEKGVLYTLVYGSLISRGAIDPIEKKPLYNYWPGHSIFSIATVGCNFHCKHCQNWDISQCIPTEEGDFSICEEGGHRGSKYPLTKLMPEEVIKLVKKSNCKLIAYTYNEPLIWHEYIMDVAKLAKKEGILNVLVTNGYSTPEASEQLVTVMDASNVDIKGFSDNFYKKICSIPSLKPVLDTCIFWKSKGMHIEITNLIIPNENDNLGEIDQMCKWIKSNLGDLTPIHFSAYHPDYKLNNEPTPSEILEQAYDLAKKEGLKHVYLGNLRVSKGNNTFCPNCGNLLIERMGWALTKIDLNEDNTCPKCNSKTGIIGKSQKRNGFFI